MDRIKGAGHVNNRFVSEDAATNRPPTEITDAWMNGVQEELVAIATMNGAVLDPAVNTQARDAIVAYLQQWFATVLTGHMADADPHPVYLTVAEADAALLASFTSFLATVNLWSKGQAGAIVPLADAATVAVDLALANNFKVTLGGNRTLGNPPCRTNPCPPWPHFLPPTLGSGPYDPRAAWPIGAAQLRPNTALAAAGGADHYPDAPAAVINRQIGIQGEVGPTFHVEQGFDAGSAVGIEVSAAVADFYLHTVTTRSLYPCAFNLLKSRSCALASSHRMITPYCSRYLNPFLPSGCFEFAIVGLPIWRSCRADWRLAGLQLIYRPAAWALDGQADVFRFRQLSVA